MAEGKAVEYLTGDPVIKPDRVAFTCPVILPNPTGWGPTGPLAEEFKDMPYQPFSKSDRIGKAADITGTAYQGRGNRYQSQFGAGDAYGYFAELDESSFNLVNTKKAAANFQRRRWQNRTSRRDLHRARDDRRLAGAGLQPLSKSQKNRDRDRSRLERQWQKRWAGRRAVAPRQEAVDRMASVDVKVTWKILEEVEMNRLTKLQCDVGRPEDLLKCGSLEFYDKTFDRVSVKHAQNLVHSDRSFPTVTTLDDPNIREMAKGSGNVFATDAVLAAIMTAPRSVYSWDIVITKVAGKIFLDKRDDSEFDYLTVDESAFTPPTEEGPEMNGPGRLSFEATAVNRAFSQQCLTSKVPAYNFDNPNPFTDDDEEACSVGYRYRQWSLGDDSRGNGISLVARTEHDAVFKDLEGRTGFMTVKSLNEYVPDSSMDWRKKLDTQRGAVLATALKNNSAKIGRWVVSALLAGSSKLQIGYITRTTVNDNTSHKIIGTQGFKPKDFAGQINLDMKNCFAIVKAIVEIVRKFDDGKFVLLRDPNKSCLKFYSVPPETFDSDGAETDESDDEGDGITIRTGEDDGFKM